MNVPTPSLEDLTPETRDDVLAELTTAADNLADAGVRLREIIARLESLDPADGGQAS